MAIERIEEETDIFEHPAHVINYESVILKKAIICRLRCIRVINATMSDIFAELQNLFSYSCFYDDDCTLFKDLF